MRGGGIPSNSPISPLRKFIFTSFKISVQVLKGMLSHFLFYRSADSIFIKKFWFSWLQYVLLCKLHICCFVKNHILIKMFWNSVISQIYCRDIIFIHLTFTLYCWQTKVANQSCKCKKLYQDIRNNTDSKVSHVIVYPM